MALRSIIGLTQAEIGEALGVSRHSVGSWETGVKYPKADHLKQLISLAVAHQAFRAGQEAEEIRALWQTAHQKMLLDENWLAELLSPRPASAVNTPLATTRRTQHTNEPLQQTRRVDWDNALAVPSFFGRERELSLLAEWVIEEGCHLIGLLGLGGIGKSALAIHLMRQIEENFDVVIWRSLRDSLTCEVLIDDCLQVLAPGLPAQMPARLEQRLNLLLTYLRDQRMLIVLDNLESLLEEGVESGRLRAGYEDYARFFQLVGESGHQSCLVFTSREKPTCLASLEGQRSSVRILRLAQLEAKSCELLLAEKGVTGNSADKARLIDAYAGNPLALKIVTQTIVDLFDGEIALFLAQGEIIFGTIRTLLDEQVARLSSVEQSVLLWLAILREPSTLDELMAVFARPLWRIHLLEAIEALYRRSLVERGKRAGSFTLHSVVLEYATAWLLTKASRGVEDGKLDQLVEYGLCLAQAKEYVRYAQEQLLVIPLLNRLHNIFRSRGTIEARLLSLLSELRDIPGESQGYAPANLVALLRLHRGSLRGLDLSRLTLRSVHFQDVEMQDTSLAGAVIQESSFSEPFDTVSAIAVNRSGETLAAVSRHREIRLWDIGGLTLRQSWRAHTDMVHALTFSPDGETLATTGGGDGTVKLWRVSDGALLWQGRHQNQARTLAFAPDSRLLASSGGDETVLLWDVPGNTLLQTLRHPNPVTALAWLQADSPDYNLLATGDVTGSIWLWEMRQSEPARCIQTLTAHTDNVQGLAFSPDGSLLASASWDCTVKLWAIEGANISAPARGKLWQTLMGHTSPLSCVVWSPDGRTLASSSSDCTVRLWDLKLLRCRAVLQGHRKGLCGCAFMHEGRTLVSGSADGTIRLWDVESGQCLRIVQGYANAVYDVDWSPDGTQLVSGGSDALVALWDLTSNAPPRLLAGHTGVVIGVGWSGDGSQLATSEWNNAIRIWNPHSGDCLELLQYTDGANNCFDRLAWSPDSKRLASGTFARGVQVYEMAVPPAQRLEQRWGARPLASWIRHLAWSPNGAMLAGGGADGIVYVWDATAGALLHQFTGHYSTIIDLAWNLTGTRLASGSMGAEGGELFVWDIARGERVAALTGHPEMVFAVCWGAQLSADDELLVSADGNGALRGWNAQGGELRWMRQAHTGRIHSLRRSPDGSTLASCGDDGAIMLWDMQSGEYLRTLRRDRPYERTDITGMTGITDAQRTSLISLGAIIGSN
jgi:WD40 repeat protein/transcriptional regulator with XRE-family HTH domain